MINKLEDLKQFGYNIDNLSCNDWTNISINVKLSESFIKKFENEVNWNFISELQKLSENFIREFKDKVNWRNISIYQKLSESFIKEFKDYVDWGEISEYQKLSEDFIREFKDKVIWYNISNYQKLSECFIKEFIKLGKITDFEKQLIEDSWYYKTTEYKKQEVIKTKTYDCYDDYFIAYKGIRSDNYSVFNFQYQYLPNNTYEAHADYSNGESSFGLSIWALGKVKYYYNQKIIKVKVRYEDVARVVYRGGKIRCCKFEVVEELGEEKTKEK